MKKLSALAVLLILIINLCITQTQPASSDSATPNSWSKKAPMQVARADLGVAQVDGKIYAIGGATKTIALNTPLRSPYGEGIVGINEQYDPVNDSWTYKSPMPTPRFSFAIATHQGKIYCIGGAEADGTLSNVNEVYDTVTDAWERKTPIPQTFFPMYANVINGKIYVVGGNEFKAKYFNFLYDPTTDQWTTNTPMSNAPCDYSATEADGKIFVLGGVDLMSGGGYSNQIYNTKNDSWTYGRYPQSTVFGPSASVTTGIMAPKLIYLIGGGQSIVNGGQPLFPTQIFDPNRNSWSYGASMLTGRTNFGVVNINDTLYAVGGYTYTLTSWYNGGTVLGGPMTPTAVNEQYFPVGYGMPDPEYLLKHTPPKISLESPQNQTYNDSSIPLIVAFSKNTTWAAYSLDGQQNTTIAGNITIADIPNGVHNIALYANDTFGNMGTEIITFTVDKPEPFPTTAVIIFVIVIVIGISISLLLYRKRKVN